MAYLGGPRPSRTLVWVCGVPDATFDTHTTVPTNSESSTTSQTTESR